LGFTFSNRQVNPETAPLSRLRHDAGRASDAFHALVHDGKPDTGSRVSLDTMQALEGMEDAFLMRRIDADTIVFDPQPCTFSAFSPDADPWLGTCCHELDRVRQQIIDSLPKHWSMGAHLRQWPLDLDIGVGLFDSRTLR
jgi:hypothetical protein